MLYYCDMMLDVILFLLSLLLFLCLIIKYYYHFHYYYCFLLHLHFILTFSAPFLSRTWNTFYFLFLYCHIGLTNEIPLVGKEAWQVNNLNILFHLLTFIMKWNNFKNFNNSFTIKLSKFDKFASNHGLHKNILNVVIYYLLHTLTTNTHCTDVAVPVSVK